MFGLVVLALGVSLVAAQRTDFEGGTGARSLWIPYKTIAGTPLASILGVNSEFHRTTYVISCPTAQPDCAIAPNITLTEGTDVAKWTSTTSGTDVSGTVAISCPFPTPNVRITCHQNAIGSGQIRSTRQVLQTGDVVYQAVEVTATMNSTVTATMPRTTDEEAMNPTTTAAESTSMSTGAAVTVRWRGSGVAGALGCGFAALVL